LTTFAKPSRAYLAHSHEIRADESPGWLVNGSTYPASAAVVLTGAGIAVASASGTAITTATTIRLEARGGRSTFVNVRHQSHPAVGNEVILAQPVFSAVHPSQLAGHGFVTVILVGRNSSQDHATWVLRQG
jgi:hypothetical protein